MRKLRADEIECRVAQVSSKGCSLLLYKTARVDMQILDETFGVMNWETDYKEIKHLEGLKYVDVLVDGEFVQELADVNYPWAGSTNQRVIDVKKSLEQGEVVLWRSK